MAIQIDAKPESSFNNPLGLLSDCHRRIERFLDQLIQVTRQSRGGTLDEAQREALEVALRYFQKAAPLHTQDEEASLFPRMRVAGGQEVETALTALEALEMDHRAADVNHAAVDTLCRRWLADGSLSPEEARRLVDTLQNLKTLYRWHISLEDDHIFPLAGKVLTAVELTTLGREMAERRGLDPDNLPAVSRCAAKTAVPADTPPPAAE